ncbi:hypothetical protein [Sphingosinicella sp. BN140058]|uniref:hypothetical protein n=1 Tax=Sphingosinicella sp. BN140058 TaxID=1892855 RepID=UPI0013ECF3B5|nr:hypothetical protein [Sphingosinicella sp. BN140058]
MGELATTWTEGELFLEWLIGEGYVRLELASDDQWIGIRPLLFHWSMHLGLVGDTMGYNDRWCYQDEAAARAALAEWKSRGFKGEPEGWHRHPLSGRRRPEGRVELEYVAR